MYQIGNIYAITAIAVIGGGLFGFGKSGNMIALSHVLNVVQTFRQ